MSEETPGTKLELISIEIRRQQKRYHNSLQHVILFSLILLVFFSMYTALVIYKIREVATPTTVALLIAGELRDEAASDGNLLVTEDLRLLSREAAHGAVSFLPLLAGPVGEQKVRTVLAEKNLSGAGKIAEMVLSDRTYEQTLREILLLPEGKSLSEQEKKRFIGRIMKSLEHVQPETAYPLLALTPGFTGERLKALRLRNASAWTRNDEAFHDLVLCTLYFRENRRYKDSACRLLFELLTPIHQEMGFFPETGK